MRASIIIPCFNYERYLPEAIESALTQTRPAAEVIVVDDGSTDGSFEVAQAYPVRLVQQPHEGAPRAMGRGVAMSVGDCFVMLGADDRLAPNYLEETVPLLDGDAGLAFVYTAVDLFGTVERHIPARPFSLARILAANYASGSALTRRSAYEETCGYAGADLVKYEDWYLSLSMLETGWRATGTNRTTLFYRQHGQTRNQTGGPEHERAIERIIRDHPALYWPSPRVWYALHRTLFRRWPRAYVGLLMASTALRTASTIERGARHPLA